MQLKRQWIGTSGGTSGHVSRLPTYFWPWGTYLYWNINTHLEHIYTRLDKTVPVYKIDWSYQAINVININCCVFSPDLRNILVRAVTLYHIRLIGTYYCVQTACINTKVSFKALKVCNSLFREFKQLLLCWLLNTSGSFHSLREVSKQNGLFGRSHGPTSLQFSLSNVFAKQWVAWEMKTVCHIPCVYMT